MTLEILESSLSIGKVKVEENSTGPTKSETNSPCSPNNSASPVRTLAPASHHAFSVNLLTNITKTELVDSSTPQTHNSCDSESSTSFYDAKSGDEMAGIISGHDTTDDEALNIMIPDNHSSFSDVDHENNADAASSFPSTETKSPSEFNEDSSNWNHEDDGSTNGLIESMRLNSNPDQNANKKSTQHSSSHNDSSGSVQINESLVSILPEGDDPRLEHPSNVHPGGAQIDEMGPAITVKRE